MEAIMERVESTTAVGATAAPEAPSPKADQPDWVDLLMQAAEQPGLVSAAYHAFKKYSLLNRVLIARQLHAQGLPLQPINTFDGWKEVGRQVRKGEHRSIAMYLPWTGKGKKKPEGAKATAARGKGVKATAAAAAAIATAASTAAVAVAPTADDKKPVTLFFLKTLWFSLSQTDPIDGQEYKPEEVEVKDWRLASAMDFQEITERPWVFDSVLVDTKRMDWAADREISVSPLEKHQTYARLRAMARILLGHTAASPGKNVPADTALRDLEADCAAYLVAATVGFDGLDEARARIQSGLHGGTAIDLLAKASKRAFGAADKLINAGYC